MSFRLARSRVLLFAAVSALTFAAGAAAAADRQFSVAPQGLSSALQAFGRQSGETILYRSEMTGSVRSQGASGKLSPETALARILSGSQFTYRKVDGGFVVVAIAQTDRPQLIKAVAQEVAAPPPPPRVEPVAPAVAAVEEVVVTGSRIATTGYRQPTPVTVVSEQQIQRDAKVSIGDVIRELPAVGSSGSPNNGVGANNIVGGVTGLDTVNLRQLGTSRTLVLLDSQRVVASNITGVVDLGTMPTMLVQRIDVVTGGASAAWGSDAVSGVVNLVLNKRFDGLRLSAEAGDSFKWDHRSLRLQGAYGAGFAADRGRFIAAVNYLNSPDAVFANDRDWNRYNNLILNPAYTPTNGQPRLIHAENTGLAQATNGGLIQGPACLVPVVAGVCARPNPLINTRFVGQTPTLATFRPGTVAGANSVGGDGEVFYPATNNLAVVFRTLNFFNYTEYDLTDDLKASVQLNYGESRARNNSTPYVRFGNLTIQRDNAFLPDAVRTQMATLGLNSIVMGTTNINVPFDDFSYDNFVENGLGIPVSVQTRKLTRGVFSLDGKLGGDWTWNAYIQKGRVRLRVETQSNVIVANYNFAVDAVRNSAGQIVCRAALAGNPAAAGCVPLNVFGERVAGPDAIRYVNVKPGQNYQVITLDQEVAAASATGTLPFGLPAGNVSMAFGAEVRREKGEAVTDPGAAARAYAFANFSPFSGKYDVKEAFAEFDVPLIDGGFVESLALNAAGRVTDYSTSGRVNTWKVGLTSQVNSVLRLRGTASRDIRAPNLAELFNSGTAIQTNATDPRTGQNVSIFSTTSGNPDLGPEVADTLSGGVVLTPLSNLSASLDYYSIDLVDAIQSVNAQTVLARCNAGESAFCTQLDFNGPNGALSQIRTFPRNLSSVKTSGLDFQLDHAMDLGPGRLSSHLVSNYIIEQSQVALGVKTEYDGAIGGDSPAQGVPKFRATLSETYSLGAFSGTAQVRFIGEAELVKAWTARDVDDNSIPSVTYLDLRASYQVTDAAQVFAAVDNLFNVDPPNVAVSYSSSASIFSTAVSGSIHDTLGRAYRVGVRMNF
jgi:outer membrane receptor protein involved in Fe transport